MRPVYDSDSVFVSETEPEAQFKAEELPLCPAVAVAMVTACLLWFHVCVCSVYPVNDCPKALLYIGQTVGCFEEVFHSISTFHPFTAHHDVTVL